MVMGSRIPLPTGAVRSGGRVGVGRGCPAAKRRRHFHFRFFDGGARGAQPGGGGRGQPGPLPALRRDPTYGDAKGDPPGAHAAGNEGGLPASSGVQRRLEVGLAWEGGIPVFLHHGDAAG